MGNRKDRILTEAAVYVSTNWETDIPSVLIECFEKGAEWADSHPITSTEERVKVKIRNTGEDDATIIREMTKEQYEFLLDIAQDLDSEREMYSPSLYVDILENE